MNNNSYLCKFIQKHNNWRELLSASPYSINIKDESHYVIFNYNMLENPDFTLPEVQEARGIIIDLYNLEVVCWPFRKFGNYGESYVDDIDWSTARVQEKVDGSIIKVWWRDYTWQFSSNSCIAIEQESEYCELARTLLKEFSNLNKNFTYMFELVSPDTQVVVEYKEPKLYHIGTRNNKTGEEVDVDLGITKPNEYLLNSLDECIKAAAALNQDGVISAEGYVVVDSRYHRVKIKSPLYVAAHHLRSNNKLTPSRIYDIIKANEQEEYLTYFPNQKEKFDDYAKRLFLLHTHIESIYVYCGIVNPSNKVEFINKYIAKENQWIAWGWKNNRPTEELINRLSKKRLLELLY